MRGRSPFISLLALAAVAAGSLGVSAAPAQLAAAPGSPSPAALLQRLAQKPAVRIERHAETGLVRFVSAPAADPIRHAPTLAADASPVAAARSFMAEYGALFGISDASRELTVTAQDATPVGRSFVRFQQVYAGVPVIAGEVIIQTDGAGNVVSASGELVPTPSLDPTPRLSSKEAISAALAALAKEYGVPVTSLTTSAPVLSIYNPALLGGPGLRRDALVWRLEVTPATAAVTTPIREFVAVDAQSGIVALHFNQIAAGKDRRVCNANNVRDTDTTPDNNCTAAQYVRTEGQAATGNTDVDLAYDYAGATYDFFKNNFGRDSLNGAGLPLISLVKYCPPSAGGGCPYANAFWDGVQMTYGDGYASADDVVAHELTHGFTEFTSHLFYYFQSGAINESLSDVFGEFVDLTDGVGNDAASVRWQLGEDLTIGAIRNMSNPPTYGDPDRVGSANYTTDPTMQDNGGVHQNSGVNNKAASLMVDGGTFNGQTITGLGISKASQIYYEVETHLLSSGSDYADLADALEQACANLTGRFGITAGNCAEVTKVVAATEMRLTTSSTAAADAPICAAGQVAANAFSDNLENPASGNWAVSALTGGVAGWYYPPNNNPYDIDSTYASSGDYNLWGDDYGGDSNPPADYAIAMTRSIAVPSAGYLRFRHAYSFEGTTAHYDAGVVEYSTNNGSSWTDASALFLNNGYNGTVSSSFGNPLAGRSAFTGRSRGYTASRLNLSALAGQNVRFRFRIGVDASGGDYGWYVDDIQLYSCINLSTLTRKVFVPFVRR